MNMKVADLIKTLDKQKQNIVEKYCENCQQWDCDECPYEKDGEEYETD